MGSAAVRQSGQRAEHTLLLDSVLFAADIERRPRSTASTASDKTEHLYRIKSKIYSTPPAIADWDWKPAPNGDGREAGHEFGEPLAPVTPDKRRSAPASCSPREARQAMPFTAPQWARKITKEQLVKRPTNTWEYGYWWIEWGGQEHHPR